MKLGKLILCTLILFFGMQGSAFCGELQSNQLTIVYTHENRKFGELLESFTKVSDVELKVIWLDQADLKSRLVNIGQLEHVPEIIISPSDNIGMSEYGQFSQIPDKLLSKELIPASLTAVTSGSKVYGVPIIHGNHLLFYYNKAIAPEPAQNWQELLAQQSNLPQSTELITWSFMEMYWFIPFITAFGGEPLVNDQPNLDTEPVRQALNFVWQLARNNVVDVDCSYDCSVQKFIEGKAAYTINGVWAYNTMKTALGSNLGIAQLPAINGKPMLSYSSSIVASFPKQSLTGSKDKEIEKFIKYIQSVEFQQLIWSNIQELPAIESAYEQIKQAPHSDARLLLLTLEQTRPLSSHKNMSIVWEALLKGYTRYGSGAWNEQRASQYMQRTAERAIQ